MAPQGVKRRKACNACTKAKAKCSPSSSMAGDCHRCERLGKECVYGESRRQRGPRTRSRMKLLEQKVENLMSMLSANNETSQAPTRSSSLKSAIGITCESAERPTQVLPSYVTPDNTASVPSVNALAIDDPVETGLLGGHEVAMLLDEFRAESSRFFPFVLVDPSVNTDEFRHQQPFLFLSIMAVMSYRNPNAQGAIAAAFKDQVALRFTECSLKGLEALQALLVHAVYYHYFYKPGRQQLALVVQMCVAITQDLGLARKCRDRDIEASSPVLSLAENRALLGTYYIAAVFAQAWRKRTSVPYTRAITRASQSIVQASECPSDLLIPPLVQSGELMCRINDYFSYDNVDDSEVNGDTLLELSTSNFRNELQRFRDSLPESVRRNVTLRLACDIVDVMIHECSFHGNLWQSSRSTSLTTMSQTRTRMLQRSLVASQTFAGTLLGTPSSSLHHLAFPAWSGWFYSTMLVVKMVILRQTGSTGNLRVSSVPHAVGDFLPREFGGSATREICQMTATLSQASISEGATIAEEAELVSIFESFIAKLNTATPSSEHTDSACTSKLFLHKVATLQTGLLTGVKRITEKQPVDPSSASIAYSAIASHSSSAITSIPGSLSVSDQHQTQRSDAAPQHTPEMYHMQSVEPHGFAHIDGHTSYPLDSIPQLPVDDWLWTMAMNDSNMFNL